MNHKKNGTKAVILLLVLALLLGGAIGGTLAWLMTHTDPVINTFVVGDIGLHLDETKNKKSDESLAAPDRWEGKMVPGGVLSKDPHVTVDAGSEECWVFVKVTEVCTAAGYAFNDFIGYNVVTGTTLADWQEVDSGTNFKVYGRKVTAAQMGSPIYILEENAVTVQTSVTKGMLDLAATGTITLTFEAYAIQSVNLVDNNGSAVNDADTAWDVYKHSTTP